MATPHAASWGLAWRGAQGGQLLAVQAAVFRVHAYAHMTQPAPMAPYSGVTCGRRAGQRLHIWRHSRANPPLTDKQTYRGVIPESQRGHLRAQSVLLCMSYHRTTHFPEPNKVCRNNHTDSCGCDLWNRGPVPVTVPVTVPRCSLKKLQL